LSAADWKCEVPFDVLNRPAASRSGVLGIKVKIMLPWDPTGKIGPKKPLPDNVNIAEPKEEEPVTGPKSETKGVKAPEPLPVPQQTTMHIQQVVPQSLPPQ